jgi:hypothetical protein
MVGYKLDGKPLTVRFAGEKDSNPRHRPGLGFGGGEGQQGGMHGQPPPPAAPHLPPGGSGIDNCVCVFGCVVSECNVGIVGGAGVGRAPLYYWHSTYVFDHMVSMCGVVGQLAVWAQARGCFVPCHSVCFLKPAAATACCCCLLPAACCCCCCLLPAAAACCCCLLPAAAAGYPPGAPPPYGGPPPPGAYPGMPYQPGPPPPYGESISLCMTTFVRPLRQCGVH